MSEAVIRLTVPGELAYRDVAIHAVAAACRLVREASAKGGASALNLRDSFDAQLVSAVSEIFNNIVIHGYQTERASTGDGASVTPPPIDFFLHLGDNTLIVEIIDHGAAFDIDAVPAPELESLPEGGMGIHIARSCVDELDYSPGPPNRWRLTKRAIPLPRPRASTQA